MYLVRNGKGDTYEEFLLINNCCLKFFFVGVKFPVQLTYQAKIW